MVLLNPARRAVALRSVCRTPTRVQTAVASLSLSRRVSTSSSPSSKIAVVPFRQTPEDARLKMLGRALEATQQPGNAIAAMGLHWFGSAAEPIMSEFGLGDRLKLVDLKPVYYPIWRFDLLTEGKVSAEGPREKNLDGSLAVLGAHVPGNAFAPLSYLSFADSSFDGGPFLHPFSKKWKACDDMPDGVEDQLAVYDPTRDLVQNLHGTEIDIVEIPFIVSPFGVLEKARRELKRVGVFKGGGHDGVRTRTHHFDPSEWTTMLAAAYPVMFPIYVAEFQSTPSEQDGLPQRFTVVMNANEDDLQSCQVTSQWVPDVLEAYKTIGNNERLNKFLNIKSSSSYFMDDRPFAVFPKLALPRDLPTTQGGGGVHTVNDPASRATVKHFQRWMSPLPGDDTVAPSPTLSVANDQTIDWEDSRIQKWGGPEFLENRAYVKKGAAVGEAVQSLQLLSAMHRLIDGNDGDNSKTMVIQIGGGGKGPDGQQRKMIDRQPMDEMEQAMQEQVEELRSQLDDLTPVWLIDYEAAEGAKAAKKAGEQAKAEPEESVKPTP